MSHAAPHRPPSPEQLDRMLRVLPAAFWPALTVLLALLLGGLVWSVLAAANTTVSAHGVLLSPLGVADIVAPANGRLARLLVALGDRVRTGQPIAELDQPELEANLTRLRAEGAKLEEQEQQVRGFLVSEAASRDRLAAGREEQLRDRIAALRTLEATTTELAAIQQDLFNRGLAARDRMLVVRRQLQETQTQRSEAESQLLQIAADREGAVVRAERELLDLAMRRSANVRDIAWTEEERRRRSTVRAPSDGIVVEQVVNIGETAAAAMPVLRMLPGDAGTGLVGIVYIPPSSGRKVHVGMAAQIMPTAVRVERYGFIEAEVIEVSPIAATREGMMRTLKNSTLVDQLVRDGAPMQAVVRLALDPTTATGFRWSAGQGPLMVLGPGAMVEARIVTDRVPLISLVLPQADYLLARLGL